MLAKEREGNHAMRSLAAKAATVFILTGCRRGEIMGLHWKDIRGNRIKLRHGKSGPRMVWLGDEARAVIETIPRYDKIPWVFWNTPYRRPMTTIDTHWRKFREEAGLQSLRVHDLRHTFASHAAMNKETLPMIGRLLGHANAGSTVRYAHFDDDHVLEAAEQIGAAIERMLCD